MIPEFNTPDTMNEKELKKFAAIVVTVVNAEKLSQYLDKEVRDNIKKAGDSSFAPKMKDDEVFYTPKFALVQSKTGRWIITDNEAVHNILEAGEDTFTIEIFSHGKDWHGMFGRFTTQMNVAELMEYKEKEIAMTGFMGSRFNYNPRIQTNQRIFLKSVNE